MTAELAVVDGLMKGIVELDIPAVMGSLHPDVVLKEPDGLFYGGEWHGIAAFQEAAMKMWTAFEVNIDDYSLFSGDGPVVVVKLDLTVRSRSTGKSVVTRAIEVHTVREEQIVEIDVFLKDPAAVERLYQDGTGPEAGRDAAG